MYFDFKGRVFKRIISTDSCDLRTSILRCKFGINSKQENENFENKKNLELFKAMFFNLFRYDLGFIWSIQNLCH